MPSSGPRKAIVERRSDAGRGREEQPFHSVAYERLLELILSGQLAGGTVLNERALALKLGISRTPVREAISRLAAEGLITSHGNRSPALAQIPAREFVDILKTRKLLEVEAAGLAAQNGLSVVIIQRIRDATDRLLKQSNPPMSEEWAVDNLVHEAISGAAQNRLLAETILNLRRRVRLFSNERIAARLKSGSVEHLAIIDAVASGNVGVARERMAEHIDNVKTSVVERLLSTGTSE